MLMIALILVWGSSFVIIKIGLREGMTPISIATFRFLIAGALFSGILLSRRIRGKSVRLVRGKDGPLILFLALFGVTFFFTAQYTGIQMAGAGIAAIFVCLLSPIFITVLSMKIFKELLNRSQLFGIIIAAAGTLTIVLGGVLSVQKSTEFLMGSLLLLATPVLWTVYTLVGKKMMETYNPFVVVTYVTALGGLCLVPFSLAENSIQQIFTLSYTSWFVIFFLAISCSLIGYYIWFYVVNEVGAAVTSTFLFAEPLVTVLFAVTLFGEQITFPIIAGGFLVFIGVYLVTTRQQRSKAL
jgi:drug/metabolite transporter (DMT)-like permease